jgi:small subunit ribosomal protein S5
MVETAEQSSQLESNTIGIFRSAATAKGGRNFSFGALVVVGDKNGRVGIGYAKANEVPPAIEKAQKYGRKEVKRIQLHGGTIPHEVLGRYSASSVKIVPASPGTGVVAGATVRAVLEMAGITDCLTKSYGSNNKKNLAKATLAGLEMLRTKEDVSRVRGTEIKRTDVDDMIERGAAFMELSASDVKDEKAMEEAKDKQEVSGKAPEKGAAKKGEAAGGGAEATSRDAGKDEKKENGKGDSEAS